MTYSARFNSIRPTNAYSSRNTTAIRFVLHGAAMTSLEGLSGMIVSQSRQVSAHGGFKDAFGIGWINEEFRAWSLSDATQDSLAYTLENANESTSGYTFTPATQESIAQWIADVARRKGIWPHRSGDPKTWTVIGHSEVYTIHRGSYATACPTTLDLNWITARAQQLLATPKQEADDDMPKVIYRDPTAKNGLTKRTIIRYDGSHKDITQDTALAEIWANSDLSPVGTGGRKITESDADVAFWNWLVALPLPPFGASASTPDIDEEALARALAPYMSGATKADVNAAVAGAVTAIKAAIPTSFRAA